MSENELEMWATLAIWFIGAWFVGSTVGWWAFLRLFGIVDNYLQDRQFRQKGWDKVTSEDGEVWYVGYDDHP